METLNPDTTYGANRTVRGVRIRNGQQTAVPGGQKLNINVETAKKIRNGAISGLPWGKMENLSTIKNSSI